MSILLDVCSGNYLLPKSFDENTCTNRILNVAAIVFIAGLILLTTLAICGMCPQGVEALRAISMAGKITMLSLGIVNIIFFATLFYAKIAQTQNERKEIQNEIRLLN